MMGIWGGPRFTSSSCITWIVTWQTCSFQIPNISVLLLALPPLQQWRWSLPHPALCCSAVLSGHSSSAAAAGAACAASFPTAAAQGGGGIPANDQAVGGGHLWHCEGGDPQEDLWQVSRSGRGAPRCAQGSGRSIFGGVIYSSSSCLCILDGSG